MVGRGFRSANQSISVVGPRIALATSTLKPLIEIRSR
jgi:hypothetical protein